MYSPEKRDKRTEVAPDSPEAAKAPMTAEELKAEVQQLNAEIGMISGPLGAEVTDAILRETAAYFTDEEIDGIARSPHRKEQEMAIMNEYVQCVHKALQGMPAEITDRAEEVLGRKFLYRE